MVIPAVLDSIIGSPWKMSCYKCPAATPHEPTPSSNSNWPHWHIISYNNGSFSLITYCHDLNGEVPSLDIRIQVVFPPLPTTLTTPAQRCQLCDIWPSRSKFLLLHSKSTRSSSSVHRGFCSSGLAIMDFPAKMEEINPIIFSWNILQ